MAIYATIKWISKFEIEKNIAMDNLLKDYIEEGINWANQWAINQSHKPSGEQKYARAVEHINMLIQKSPLHSITEDHLKAAVEARLIKKIEKSKVITE